MGWEALAQWGENVARIAPLAGGVANDVWSVRVSGHLAVGRLGGRSGRLRPKRSRTSSAVSWCGGTIRLWISRHCSAVSGPTETICSATNAL